MARYTLTTPATNDLHDIIKYIRDRSPQSAKIVRSEFRMAMRRLAAFPRIGHVREDVADESLRFWSVYSRSRSFECSMVLAI
jgi:plasmid stabilization system protein ParE